MALNGWFVLKKKKGGGMEGWKEVMEGAEGTFWSRWGQNPLDPVSLRTHGGEHSLLSSPSDLSEDGLCFLSCCCVQIMYFVFQGWLVDRVPHLFLAGVKAINFCQILIFSLSVVPRVCYKHGQKLHWELERIRCRIMAKWERGVELCLQRSRCVSERGRACY